MFFYNLLDRDRFKSIDLFSYLYYLLPVAIITGPFLSDLFLSCISIYFIFLSFKHKLYNYYRNYFVYLFLAFYFALIISSFFSIDRYESFTTSIIFIRYLLFALATIYLINHVKNFKKNMFLSLSITFFILGFDAYFQKYNGFNLLGWETDSIRVSGLFGDEHILGTYFARLMPIFFGLYASLNLNSKKSFLFMLVALILIEILTFISGERTAFTLLTLSTIIIILFIRKYKTMRVIALIVSSLIIFIILNTNEPVRDRMINQTISETGIGTEDVKLFSSVHESFFETSLKMFIDSPIVGQGPRTFRIACSDTNFSEKQVCSTHPHNIYFELLGETGAIGIIPLCILLVYASFCLIYQFYTLLIVKTKSYLSDEEVCYFAAIVINIFPFVPSFSFYNNLINVMVIVSIAFAISSKIAIKK